MTQPEQNIGNVEQVVSPELDQRPAIAFVYRGANPFMGELTQRFITQGDYKVKVCEVSIEDADRIKNLSVEYFGDPENKANTFGKCTLFFKQRMAAQKDGNSDEVQRLEEEEKQVRQEGKQALFKILGESPSDVIISDRTLIDELNCLNGGAGGAESAYWSLPSTNVKGSEDVIEMVMPIIEELKARGFVPVVLSSNLGDHFYGRREIDSSLTPNEMYRELRSLGWEGPGPLNEGHEYMRYFYSGIINKKLGLPVINREFKSWGVDPIENNLKEVGVSEEDLNKVVLLSDHHIYLIAREKGEQVLQRTGLDKIPIVRICPCCIGLREQQEGISDGLTYLTTNGYSHEIDGVVENLNKGIKKRMESQEAILKEEREKEQALVAQVVPESQPVTSPDLENTQLKTSIWEGARRLFKK